MGKTRQGRLKFIVKSAIIAALYAGVTLAAAPISFGPLQVRISEALTVLPYFTASAVPGLFAGCVIANVVAGGGFGLADIILGSLATLAAALLTRRIKNKWLVPLPSVLINAPVVGGMIAYFMKLPFFLTTLYIAAGQTAACYIIGMPLLLALERYAGGFLRRDR